MHALLFCQYEDEAVILKSVLQQIGLETRLVSSLDKAIESWPEKPADLIFITTSDLKDQDMIKLIRNHTVVPMVLLTDMISEEKQVELYEAGVDLVITRPYSVRLLMANIRSLLRRTIGLPFFSLPTLSYDDISLVPGTRTVQVFDAEPIKLTQLEFRLLYSLMTHSGHIIPTENIVEQVWGYQGEGNLDLVRGLVQRLRAKVEPDPSNPQFIITEQGIGYYFNRS